MCLYSFLGRKTVTPSELFKGAEFTFDFPAIKVTIPDYRNVSVHHLSCRYISGFPSTKGYILYISLAIHTKTYLRNSTRSISILFLITYIVRISKDFSGSYTFAGSQIRDSFLAFSISLISFPLVIYRYSRNYTVLYINTAPPHYIKHIPGVAEEIVLEQGQHRRFNN